jgi:hypothetical protein
MITNVLNTLNFSKNLVVSPDIDGFISAKLLQDYNSDYIVVGTYDKNILTLSEDIKAEDCLFLDCDMNRPDLVSIGNHMRLGEGDNVSLSSFNPNNHFETKKYTDKYPFATAFLISAATRVPTSHTTKTYMAYADSTYKNLVKYSDNMYAWKTRMEHSELDFVFDLSAVHKEQLLALEDVYPKQGFVSKRYGKTKYIAEMNNALKAFGLKTNELKTGKKFLSDKVGKNTVLRYSSDMISYAEIFGGEYSVTYDQEMKWA